jgi:hypothetical protein
MESKLASLDHERDIVAAGIVGIICGLWQMGALDDARMCEANREALRQALIHHARLSIEIQDELATLP